MKRLVLPCLPLLGVLLLGCPVPISSDQDAGSGVLTVGDAAAVVATSGPTATGEGCTVQTSSGTFLCTAISLCPTIAIDPGTFNGCGFRIRGDVIDLECECMGYLCPIGAPATCAQAATLLTQENSGSVCSQTTSGTCIQEAQAVTSTGDAGTTTTTSPGTSPGCDTTCESECVSDPNCIQACGC